MDEQKTARLTGNQLMQLLAQEERKLEDINRKIKAFQEFRLELLGAHDSLRELEKASKGEKILVNLGSGVYIEASLEENEKAIAALAGNVFTAKTSKELQNTLKIKMENIDKSLRQIGGEQQKTISRLNQLENLATAARRHVQQQAQKN